MKPSYFAIALMVLLAVLPACSTPDRRISQHQAAFNALSPEDQGKVRGGRVELGFTPEMVLMALGDPDRRYERTTDKGTDEVWAYLDQSPSFSIGLGVGGGSRSSSMGAGVGIGTGDRSEDKVRVVFKNGRVAGIERKNATH